MKAETVRRTFTVREYHRMGEAGILRPDDRTELIDGEVFVMPPIGAPHASCVDRMNALFVRALGDRAIVRVQSPIVIGRLSEPQPDLAVLRPREDFYAARHPGPADVLWLVEVADSTARFDRVTKLPVYARGGIAEAWVVDVRRGVVEVSRGPMLRGYRTCRTADRTGAIRPLAFPRTSFAVRAMLGTAHA